MCSTNPHPHVLNMETCSRDSVIQTSDHSNWKALQISLAEASVYRLAYSFLVL